MADCPDLWNSFCDLDDDNFNSLDFHYSEMVNGFDRKHSGNGKLLLSCVRNAP
jgi:hypothetical protein